MSPSNGASFFVLVEFLCQEKKRGVDLPVSVIPNTNIKNCPVLEEMDEITNGTVKVKCDTKGKSTEYFQAKVLAHSESRPELVALMGTYIKTGQLATPSNSKRGRIPKNISSSSSDEGSETSKSLENRPMKAKKLQKANKVSASMHAARAILSSYESLSSSPKHVTVCENSDNIVEDLKRQNEHQARQIVELKSKLRAVTLERDGMIDAHDTNMRIAVELRKALKYAKRLASSPTSSATASSSSQSTRTNSAASNSGPELGGCETVERRPTEPCDVHPHLRHKETDIGVVRLGKSSVFVNGANFSSVVNTSTSCTMLCRNLLELVYTAESLARCSVRGRKANGLGKGAQEAREPLYQIGINTIIDFAISQGKASHWKIQDACACVSAMGKRLNEIRHVNKVPVNPEENNVDEDAS